MSMGVVSAVEWMPVESGLFSSAAYRAGIRQLYLTGKPKFSGKLRARI
jgi:hypothetical protein